MSIKEFENFKESSLILNNLGSFVHAQIVEIDNNINNSFLLNEKSILPQSNSLFYSHPIFAIFISILIFILIVITILGNLGVCAAILLVRKLKAQPANLLLISLALADFCKSLCFTNFILYNKTFYNL